MKGRESRTVQLVTLGCSKNRVDSEHLLRQIALNSFTILPSEGDFFSLPPQILIINSCGFIKDAKEESLESILLGVEAKKRGLVEKLYVFGCLSQRYKEELRSEIPEVDHFFGVFERESIAQILGFRWSSNLSTPRLLTTPPPYGSLKISEGCDRGCSYCAIPLIRGGHKSIPQQELVDEANSLAQMGVKELIVIAQDTTYYGLDLYGERRVASLLERLSQIKEIERIRLLYSYPHSFPLELLQLMLENPKICRYIDIPLQHINDGVLSNMRRGIDSKSTIELLEKIRKSVPGVVLRTTLIVGHPGESQEAFNQLKEFVREIGFERLGAFTYSAEEGTWGYSNLKDTIPQEVKQQRYEELMEIQAECSLNYNISRVGSTARVLIDSFENGLYFGRSEFEAPEVDGEIVIGGGEDDGSSAKKIIGTFADVKIESADHYDLMGHFI